jgi:hypothetical protein
MDNGAFTHHEVSLGHGVKEQQRLPLGRRRETVVDLGATEKMAEWMKIAGEWMMPSSMMKA